MNYRRLSRLCGLVLLGFLAAAEGCSAHGKSAQPPPQEAATAPTATALAPSPARRLENGFSSERALAEAVLIALKERDAALLQSLRVTEKEYKEIFFPEFPAAKGNVPVEFHWGHLDIRSGAGIENAIQEYGGLDLELIDVRATRGVETYPSFKLLSKVELLVRLKDGRTMWIKVFGSVVALDGQYKILGFPT